MKAGVEAVHVLPGVFRRKGCHMEKKPLRVSEDRKRIEGRSGSLIDPQRRGHEQKFVAIRPPCLLGCSFEIEIVEDAHAHGNQRQAIQRVCDRRWKAGG